MGKSTPGRLRATRWLVAFLVTRTAGARLPAVRQMAAEAGVSHVTMFQALRSMASRGVLARERGAGYRLVSASGVAEAEREALQAGQAQRWERTATRMRADILAAAPDDPSPALSVKELQHRYGVSFRTMRKALDRLASESYVTSTPSGYRVSGPSSARRGGVVGLLILSRERADIRMLPPRTIDVFTRLEDACVRANLRLQPLWYVHTVRGPVPETVDRGGLLQMARSADTVGMVAWPSGMAELAWQEVAGTLSAAGKPLAIIDETGNQQLPAVAARYQSVRLFSFSFSPACGSHMGRYLLRLGHRCVAYISSAPEGAWSRNRLAHLRQFENVLA